MPMKRRAWSWLTPAQAEKNKELLAEAREDAETIEIDGKIYTLVRVPDLYPEGGPTGSRIREDEKENMSGQ